MANQIDGVATCKTITSTSKQVDQKEKTSLNLYEEISEVSEFIDRLRKTPWIKEYTVYMSHSQYVPKSITTVDGSGNKKVELFLSTKQDHLSQLGGLTYEGVHILGGDWSNDKLNYIFSRIRHSITPSYSIVPMTSEVHLDGGDLPSWTDAPIRSSILLGGLVVWLLYLAKGVI